MLPSTVTVLVACSVFFSSVALFLALSADARARRASEDAFRALDRVSRKLRALEHLELNCKTNGGRIVSLVARVGTLEYKLQWLQEDLGRDRDDPPPWGHDSPTRRALGLTDTGIEPDEARRLRREQ